MKSLLITQCLQNDFVRPIEIYEALPNLLHVGHSESQRLMGDRPSEGPLARVMRWAYESPAEDLAIVHLRDWHDPEDPSQQEHLERFGEHCLKHTSGADFCFESPAEEREVQVIDSLGLNDFHQTELELALEPFSHRPIRVGLVGVWTEAKIQFLAYELKTRYANFEIAVCSALTASSSRHRHFEALDQMERILGIRILHSIGSFVDFLGGRELDAPLLGLHERFPIVESNLEIPTQDKTLLRYLFRDCRQVEVKVLDGGFSGNLVLGTESVDLSGQQQVPHVVKIGPQELMGKERTAFERIQKVLGNNAPQITEFADYENRGGIKYRYASMGGEFSTTFQKLVESCARLSQIEVVLKVVFGEQLSRLYRAATLEETDLLEHYQFSSRWAPGVRRRVEKILSCQADGEHLQICEGHTAPNLCRFYEKDLDELRFGAVGSCYHATVHGDLNGANIIIDANQNVWLIDFFHTRRAHVLMDLIKLENDLLYIFTKLENKAELAQACQLAEELLKVEDLAEALPEKTWSEEKFQRTWDILRILRSFYADLIGSDRNPYQLWVGQLRYAAHSLGFDECSLLQKRWALYSAGHLAEKITQAGKESKALRVDWMPRELTEPAKLGLTILPGRKDRERDLEEDLDSLKGQGVEAVLCMVTAEELKEYGVPNLLEAYQEKGFERLYLPVVDQKVCSSEDMEKARIWMEEQIALHRNVLVHCVGGLGRSGFAVASFLKARGLSAEEAISTVREHRSPRAVETRIQENFVRSFPV